MPNNSPDTGSKTGAVLTWIAGIAGTVIASVLIYYFTVGRTTQPQPQPQPQVQQPQPQQPPQPVPQIGLNGFVQDQATHQPVVNAIVTADLGNKLASQPTDSEGRYAFFMDNTTPPIQSVNIDVLAGGYLHYTDAVSMAATGDTFAGVLLQPDPSAPPKPGQPVGPVHLLPKQPLILRVPQNYAMRKDTATLKSK